jgi:hypothetical protein
MSSKYQNKFSFLKFCKHNCKSGKILLLYFLFIICSLQSEGQDKVFKETNTGKETQMKMQSKINGDGLPVILVPGGLTGWISWDAHAEVTEFPAGHAPHIVSMDKFLEKLALFQNNV